MQLRNQSICLPSAKHKFNHHRHMNQYLTIFNHQFICSSINIRKLADAARKRNVAILAALNPLNQQP